MRKDLKLFFARSLQRRVTGDVVHSLVVAVIFRSFLPKSSRNNAARLDFRRSPSGSRCDNAQRELLQLSLAT